MKSGPVLLFALCCGYSVPSDVLLAQTRSSRSYIPEVNWWSPDAGGASTGEQFADPACEWKRIQTPVVHHLLDAFFIDPRNGWASHTGNGCIRTTDGGTTWEVTTFDDTNFVTSYEGVFFANADTGWCVGGATQIRKTTNGGSSWFKQHGPPVEGINRGVHFLDESTGYVVGSKNYPYEPFVSKTTDGGASWTELVASSPAAFELIDQYWFTADTGWLCGYNALFYTANGGATFVDKFPNVPPTGNGHNVLLAIDFVDPQTGWLAAGNLETTNIYKTTNGGDDWVFQDNPVSQNGWNQINDVMFVSPDSGWAVHGTPGTGAIMFTSNGGTDWVMDNTEFAWYDCLARSDWSRIRCGASEGGLWLRRRSSGALTGVPGNEHLPLHAVLHQNYPNPFNPQTDIGYRIKETGHVTLTVFDLLGHEVATLVNEKKSPGGYTVTWDATGQASGIYFYRLASEGFVQTRKLVLLR